MTLALVTSQSCLRDTGIVCRQVLFAALCKCNVALLVQGCVKDSQDASDDCAPYGFLTGLSKTWFAREDVLVLPVLQIPQPYNSNI